MNTVYAVNIITEGDYSSANQVFFSTLEEAEACCRYVDLDRAQGSAWPRAHFYEVTVHSEFVPEIYTQLIP
jgi:hypothetical protein